MSTGYKIRARTPGKLKARKPKSLLWVGYVDKDLMDDLELIRLEKGWNKQTCMAKVIWAYIQNEKLGENPDQN